MRKVMGFVVILVAIVSIWKHVTGEPSAPSREEMDTQAADASAAAPQYAVERPDFRCDGRVYCSQMTSCAEARYFLKHCPGVKMDGEGDGNPCEGQWCGP
jgi:hypothetical protein